MIMNVATQEQLNELNDNLTELGTYSITENKIGKLGNDDLYRRCIISDNANISANAIIDSSFKTSDIKMLRNITTSCLFDGVEWDTNLCSPYGNTVTQGTVIYRAYARIAASGVQMMCTGGLTIQKYCVTIEYTKA